MKGTLREGILIAVGALTFALAFTYPILRHFGQPGFNNDWDFTWQLHWVPYLTVVHFHQFPFWNPYKCGGMPMLANPQARFLTPFFLLHLIWGPVVGLQLEIVMHLAIAWAGGYVLARAMGRSALAAILCGSLFPGSSWFYLHMGVGQAVFLPALYLPWFLALLWIATEQRKLFMAALSGVVLALMFFEGGVYSVTQAGLFAGLLGLVLAIQWRSGWPLMVLGIASLFAAGLAAPKLLPSFELMQQLPRPTGFIVESHRIQELLAALFSRIQNPALHPQLYGIGQFSFWEIGAYVSPLVAPLVLLGIITRPRQTLPWLIASLVVFGAAIGDVSRYAPWSLFHHLPIFSSERVVARFLIPLTLALGVIAACGVDFLTSSEGRFPLWVVGTMVATVVLDLWLVSPPLLLQAVGGTEPTIPVSASFQQVNGRFIRFNMYAWTRANQGTVNCYEYAEPQTTVLGYRQPGYRGEQYLNGPGSIKLLRWTPNVLTYEVDLSQPGVATINQNYDRGWRLVRGQGRVFSSQGLLALCLPRGRQRLEITYHSPPTVIGTIIALAVIGFIVALY
jgi:hypothetical protein